MKFFLLLIFFPLGIIGQPKFPEYAVSLVSGNVIITEPGKKNALVKSYQSLYKNQSITLKKGTELVLIDKYENYYELKTTGLFKIGELSSKLKKTNIPGPRIRYLKFIYDETFNFNHDPDLGSFVQNHPSGSIAGEIRSGDCVNRIFPIDSLFVSRDSLVFRWHSKKTNPVYSLFIGYKGENPVRFDIKDTFFTVPIMKIAEGKSGRYSWIVNTAGDTLCNDPDNISNMPWVFTFMRTEEERKKAEELIANTEGNTFEGKLQQVDKLEKVGLIFAASSRYSAFVKANQENKALRRSYVLFLLQYGFYEEARMMWK